MKKNNQFTNKNRPSPRWIPVSQGFIWLLIVSIIFSLFGFNLTTFLIAFVPAYLGFTSLKTGLFGSDNKVNKMVSSIQNKYLKILESDNIDIDQVLINLDYLEAAQKNLLYPKKILSDFIKQTSPEDIEKFERKFIFTERQKYLLTESTPTVIKIAYSLLLPGTAREFLPEFFLDNPRRFFWFIAAYPDVVDFFYTTRDLLSNEYKEDFHENYRYYMDVIVVDNCKKMDLFEKFLSDKLTKSKSESADFNQDDMLIELKKYYKGILHKKYILEMKQSETS